MVKRNSVAKRLARVERAVEMDKPEVKSLDVLLNPIAPSQQQITSSGIYNGVTYANYDLTRGFLQGLQNDQGNLDGNYCKLTSLDLRILLDNTGAVLAATNISSNAQVRLMIVRLPAAETLTPADIQSQVLAYGAPATYGALVNVSPLKRNTTINGGYDVLYDRVHVLTTPVSNSPTFIGSPLKATKYIHFRKKWKKGLTLRFSGGGGTALTLEQNRIVLFAMDFTNVTAAPPTGGVKLSFISRVRYSDE